MKAELWTKESSRALKMVATAIDTRPVTPAAAGIQIDAEADGTVWLTATNGRYEARQKVNGNVTEEGRTLLDGKRLVQMFSSMSGETVTIEAGGGKPVTLKSRGARFTTPEIAGEMPQKQDVNKEIAATAEISAGELKQSLENVKYAISTDETRMVLTGVLMQIRGGNVTFVALDGFRMGVSRKEAETSNEMDIIIPAGTVAQIIALCSETEASVFMETDGKTLHVVADNAEITSTLLSGEYMDYRSVIPKDSKTSIRFDRWTFVEALKRAIISSSKSNLMKVMIRDGEIEIRANDAVSTFNEIIPCQKTGEDVETAYNVRYAMDVLSAIHTDDVQLDMSGMTRPGLLKPVDGGKELHVLLPVRVVNE